MQEHTSQGTPIKMPTQTQVSAGGVVIRLRPGHPSELVLIAAGPLGRWQLPKGLIEPGETPEQAATREVREETGIVGALVAPLEVVSYWYVASRQGERIRFHKFVHFFLFTYVAGDVSQHDHEVSEARWMTFAEASQRLNFAAERRVVEAANHYLRVNAPEG